MPPTASVRFRKNATVFVWLVGLAIAASLLLSRPAGDAQGIAWAAPTTITAPEDGALLQLTAHLHELVEQGQLVARLDPAPLLARNQILIAELEALSAEESAEAAGRTRRFQSDSEQARLEQARLRASVAEQEVQLIALKSELAREADLSERGLRAASIAQDLQRQLEVAEARLAADRERLALAAQTARETSARALTASGPNRWQIVAAERRLDEIGARLNRLELRSPIEGQVTQLESTPGEWLEAGQQVLRISPTSTSEVHVWTDVQVARRSQVGQPATVRRATGERLPALITSVSVERLPLPRALWYRSDIREWGYLVRVHLQGEELTPGEPVRVSLRS